MFDQRTHSTVESQKKNTSQNCVDCVHFKMAEGNTPTTSTTTSTSPSVSISDYPELPLLTIFDYVPLVDLFHIDEVCRAWQELKPAALNGRRELAIANDPADLNMLHLCRLEPINLPRLDGKKNSSPSLKFKVRLDLSALFIGHNCPLQTTVDRVLELLPNLTVFHLVQLHGTHEELSKVNQLLAHYRHQLVEVTIWFWGELTDDDRNRAKAQLAFQQKFLTLMANLNRLTALRSLELNFQSPPNCPVVLDDHQLATHCLPDVVGRLKWLKFRTRLEFDNYSNSFPADTRLLNQVLFRIRDGGGADKVVAGEGSKSKQQPKKQQNLELHIGETPLTLRTLVSLGPGPIAASLRRVEIDGMFSADSPAEYKALARFARQSPHLKVLALHVKSLRIRRLVESLASLQELVNLCIFCLPAPSSPPEKVNIDQLPVMPSVKLLEMHFSANSHRDYEQLHLEVLFPNLTTILWDHMGVGCGECGYLIPREKLALCQLDPNYLRRNASQFKADYGQQMQKCLRLARLAAFSRLPQLAYLFLSVTPLGVNLPFQPEVFTSHGSLSRQTEFLLKENSSVAVVYND